MAKVHIAYPDKAAAGDLDGRFREIISDPLNLLIDRVPLAGTVDAGGRLCLHNGNYVELDGAFSYYGPFSRILLLNRGVHEPLEDFVFQVLLRQLGERPCMLELGAYWAHYSMWLKCLRPLAAVTLVEPDGRNLATGKHNFAINGYDGNFIQRAVGYGQFSVDAFLAEREIAKLDILHADIQGQEAEMMGDSQKSLARRAIDYLLVSTHGQKLHHDIARRVCDAGYRLELSSDYDYETTSHDGLIFASNPELPAVFTDFRPLGRLDIVNASARTLLESLWSRLRKV